MKPKCSATKTALTSTLNQLSDHYEDIYETGIRCRFCEKPVYRGQRPKDNDQHLPDSMFGCGCARFTTDLFQKPFTEKQWNERIEPLQSAEHNPASSIAENSRPEPPVKRESKKTKRTSVSESESKSLRLLQIKSTRWPLKLTLSIKCTGNSKLSG
jgi:hypothetical protein